MNVIIKLPGDIRDTIKSYVIGYKDIVIEINGHKKEIWIGPQKYRTGVFRQWYPEGQLWYECNWNMGKRHGPEYGWYSTGQLSYENKYHDDKRHGILYRWYQNGQLWYEITYYEGKRHGLERGWSRTGQLNWETNYCDDKLI